MVAALGARLGVPPGTIDDWRMGLAAMPQDRFLELVDLLSSIDPSRKRTDPGALAAEAVKRLVVVDDNADAAVTLAHLLERLGHQATAVIDPRNAVRVAKEVRPHIAIGLPPGRPDGDGQPELPRDDRRAGFDAHLKKPADAALLRAIIEQFQDR